jgi:hypothetical protein
MSVLLIITICWQKALNDIPMIRLCTVKITSAMYVPKLNWQNELKICRE